MRLIAKTFQGLEEALADELRALGASDVLLLKRAVQFEGDQKLLYRSNLELRTALRILKSVHTFRARHENHLYKKIREFNWTDYLSLENTFAVDAVTNSDYFPHSKYAALKTKDAIADEFRKRLEARPNVDVHDPDLQIHLHIQDDHCTLAFDSSGESLHKRGYRHQTGEAPISEVLAAGMLLLSGWQADCDLLDPMCGSGTIAIEAGFIARNMPALWHRKNFGFAKWKDFDKNLWETVRKEALGKTRPFEHRIFASDSDGKAVKMATQNVFNAEMEDIIFVQRKKFETLEAPSTKGFIIMNPPYDERLQVAGLFDLYKRIGDTFKQTFKGWTAWVISSNMEAIKHIGLRPSKKIVLFNGALECKFQEYQMYEGSRKPTTAENSQI